MALGDQLRRRHSQAPLGLDSSRGIQVKADQVLKDKCDQISGAEVQQHGGGGLDVSCDSAIRNKNAILSCIYISLKNGSAFGEAFHRI